MLSNTDLEGLEFVRAWDRRRISAIATVPFVISLLFALIWIPVSAARFAVDAQVAVQTAFTVASYIVTAGRSRTMEQAFIRVSDISIGALLIALFAFLDGPAK